MRKFDEKAVFFKPDLTGFEKNGIWFLIDGATPNWISTDVRGNFIFSLIDGKKSLSDLVRFCGKEFSLEASKAFLQLSHFIGEALTCQILSLEPVQNRAYPGRGLYLKASTLWEFWIHTNNSYNLTCAHWQVSSSPSGDPEIPVSDIKKIVDETTGLGVQRYYFSGGEPFSRKDIFDLIRHVTDENRKELIILTNTTLNSGSETGSGQTSGPKEGQVSGQSGWNPEGD